MGSLAVKKVNKLESSVKVYLGQDNQGFPKRVCNFG
jgi:hypothetical protein